MGPELSREYVGLVRDEAEAKKKLADRSSAIKNAAQIALQENASQTDGEQIDWQELRERYQSEMVPLFELLLTSPQNDKFTARAEPEQVGVNRYRIITLEEYGCLEVASINDITPSGEQKILNYRLAIVGLPEGFSNETSLSPVLAQLKDYNAMSSDKLEPLNLPADVERLKDQLGTLKAVCEAADLLEPEVKS
jgi:hypothetical protein